MKKRLLKALLAAGMIMSMVGCSKNESNNASDNKPTDGTFTYESYIGTQSVQTLNPCEWEFSSEFNVMGLTQRGFYALIWDKDNGYKIQPEMAKDLATDVTKDYAGQYGIPEDATEGYAISIPLREDACWEDGTPIKANDYVESLKRFLDKDMECYRASSYTEGTYRVANAYDYYYEEDESLTLDDLGFFATDDYTLVYILEKPYVSEYLLYYGLTSGMLVDTELYDANIKDTGGVLKSTYGTSVDTYKSYGPYKLTTWQDGKIITIEKNEKWYGYSSDEFKGQYQTDKVNYNIIDEHATQMLLFQQGKLDEVVLDANDLETYGTSDYLLNTPESYTYKFSFNTDKESLVKRETAGVNKTIICNINFRKAFSLAIDRADFVQSIHPTCEVAFGLYNDCYVFNPEEGKCYRDEKAAQQALCDVYDADSIDKLTGYNLEEASKLLQQAYDEALAAGDIKATDKVVLEFNANTLSDTIVSSVNFFNDAINEAAKGTDLEGRISIEAKQVDDYYYAQSIGTADCIFSAWGGSDFDPIDLLQCYVDIQLYNDGEHGFDAEQEYTATVEGKEYTLTFYEWYDELVNGQFADCDFDTKLEILATAEKNILEQYCTLPIYSLTESALQSQKVEYIDYEYNPMCESYGGMRFMTYLYNDEGWAAYCKENDNKLTY